MQCTHACNERERHGNFALELWSQVASQKRIDMSSAHFRTNGSRMLSVRTQAVGKAMRAGQPKGNGSGSLCSQERRSCVRWHGAKEGVIAWEMWGYSWGDNIPSNPPNSEPGYSILSET